MPSSRAATSSPLSSSVVAYVTLQEAADECLNPPILLLPRVHTAALHPRSSASRSVPGWSMLELAVGDAAEALINDEIGAYFSALPLAKPGA